jgi:hypothetical protein
LIFCVKKRSFVVRFFLSGRAGGGVEGKAEVSSRGFSSGFYMKPVVRNRASDLTGFVWHAAERPGGGGAAKLYNGRAFLLGIGRAGYRLRAEAVEPLGMGGCKMAFGLRFFNYPL